MRITWKIRQKRYVRLAQSELAVETPFLCACVCVCVSVLMFSCCTVAPLSLAHARAHTIVTSILFAFCVLRCPFLLRTALNPKRKAVPPEVARGLPAHWPFGVPADTSSDSDNEGEKKDDENLDSDGEGPGSCISNMQSDIAQHAVDALNEADQLNRRQSFLIPTRPASYTDAATPRGRATPSTSCGRWGKGREGGGGGDGGGGGGNGNHNARVANSVGFVEGGRQKILGRGDLDKNNPATMEEALSVGGSESRGVFFGSNNSGGGRGSGREALSNGPSAVVGKVEKSRHGEDEAGGVEHAFAPDVKAEDATAVGSLE